MKYVFANWKMNATIREGVALARATMRVMRGKDVTPHVVLFAPFTALNEVRKVMARSRVRLGAQNCAPLAKGALSGEISPAMLQDVQCDYVLIGHSERRRILGESLELTRERYLRAWESLLTPVLCVGEDEGERNSGATHTIVGEQLKTALNGFHRFGKRDVFIAYEPVWAIGGDHAALVVDMVDMHRFIKNTVAKITQLPVERIHVLYGGSVGKENAYVFLREQLVDGVLVGSASLKIKEFEGIIQSAVDVMTAQSHV